MQPITDLSNVRFLFLGSALAKAGPGSGKKIAHQSGFALYGNPPRWRKITPEKPAPKGAPVSKHPEAGGVHIPKQHFSAEQWSQLKLPDTNVNAGSFNKALDKLKEWSDAGNVTAILGAGYGVNTYGKKLAAIANSLLAQYGSSHTVTPGQKPGTHSAVASPAAEHADDKQAVKEIKAAPTVDAALETAKQHMQDDIAEGVGGAAETKQDKAVVGKLEAAQGEDTQALKDKLQMLHDFLKEKPDSPNAAAWEAKIAEIEAKVGPLKSAEPAKAEKPTVDTSGWSQPAQAAYALKQEYAKLDKLNNKAVGAFKIKLRALAKKTPEDDQKATLLLDGLATKVWGSDYDPKVAGLEFAPAAAQPSPAADAGPAPAAKGDVFKLDSQYEKMNAGDWTVYNVSGDGDLVYMHKVGAKVPNQKNSATIPAATLQAAIDKGTAKKIVAPAPTALGIPQPAAAPTSSKKATIGGIGFVAVNKPNPNNPKLSHWIPMVEATGQEIDLPYTSIKSMWDGLEHVAKIKGDEFAASMGIKESAAPAGTVMVDGKPLLADKDGKPKVYYHGTGSKAHDGNFKEGPYGGIYFASEPDVSATYVDGSADSAHEAGGADAVEQKIFARSIVAKNPMIVSAKADNLDHLHLVAEAKKKGHDALVLQNVETEDGDKLGEFVIVFSNDSIVPAAGNVADSVADPVSSKGEKFAHDGSGTLWHDTAKPADSGPKEGDTKPAADGGTLVLKDGHWVKQDGDAAAAWDAMTTDQKAAILATTSPLYTTGYTGKPNAKAKKLAAAGWDALTDAVKAKAAHLVSMYAKHKAAKKPAPVMPEKPVYAEPEADKDQSALKTIGGITFEAVKSGAVWKVKVAGTDKLIDGIHSDSKGGLWSKLSQHHSSVGADSFASEFGGKTETPLSPQQLQNLQSIPWFKLKLPAENTNAKSHNGAVAKIEAMAFAGDKAGLQAFIDAKAGAKQTYAKKQHLLAMTALAALQDDDPAEAEAAPIAAKLTPYQKKLMKIDAEQVQAWLDAEPGQKGATTAFFDHVTKASQIKFFKWLNHAGVQSYSDDLKSRFMALALGSLFGKHDQALISTGEFVSAGATNLPDGAHYVTDPVKVKAAALGLDGGAKPADKAGVDVAGLSRTDKKVLASLVANNDLQTLADGAANSKNPAYKKAAGEMLAKLQAQQPPAPTPTSKVKIKVPVYENTTPGHNKFWSVSVSGNVLKTEYGKIGTMGKSTLKKFDSNEAAQAAASKLISQKKAKGYVHAGIGSHEHEVAADQPVTAPDDGPKNGDTKRGVSGTLVFWDGHWHKVMPMVSVLIDNLNEAGLHKVIASPESRPASKGYAAAKLAQMGGADQSPSGQDAGWKWDSSTGDLPSISATTSANTHPSMDDWVQTGPQEGSNDGGKFKDESGQEWYCKFPADEDMAKSEVLAAKLYAMASLSSQDAKLVTKGGKIGIASKWVDIKKASSATALSKVDGVYSGFAVDAWLGNWDVIGMKLDNLQIGPDGKAHRVDAGGSLEYRAQGAKKEFGHEVTEINSLLDPKINPHAAAVFKRITQADITASVAKVASVSDAQIRALVFEFGPGSAADKKKLAETLIARKADLLAKYPKAAKAKPAKPQFKIENLSLPPNFENWNGSGKGLSSHHFINESNQAAVNAVYDSAKQGDLAAIKTVQAPVFDKASGDVKAHVPLEQHPSQHVKAYWSDMVNEVDLQLNPPRLPEIGEIVAGQDLGEIAALLKPVPSGGAVAMVPKHQKVGDYILLGKAINVAPVVPKASDAVIGSDAWRKKASEHYHAASAESKSAFSLYVTTSGARALNTALRTGNLKTVVADKSVAKHVENFKGLLVDIPEGSTFVRRMGMKGYGQKPNEKAIKELQQFLMMAEPGTVMQEPGFTSSSWTGGNKILGNNDIEWEFVAGKGVKMFPAWLTANKGEGEGLLPPNQRYMIVSSKKDGKTVRVKAILLPTID